MLQLFIAGGALGLAAGFAPGPLLAMVIAQTLSHGFKEGVKTAFTPLITDLPIIAISTLLVSGIYALKPILGLVSVTGGILLTYMAYENLRINRMPDPVMIGSPNSLVKGALINALSPHPYLFWVTVGSPLIVTAYAQSMATAACFIAGFYVCLIGSKVTLAYFVTRSQGFLSGLTYVRLMKLLGLALLVFAVILFKDGFVLLRE